MGLLFPIVTVVAQRVSPVQHMGIATAAPVMLRSLGGAAGVALLAALLARWTEVEGGAAALGHGLQPVFGCAAGAVLLALVACRWFPRGGERQAAQRIAYPQAAS